MEPASKPGGSALREAVSIILSDTVIPAGKHKYGHIMLSIGDGGAGMDLVKTRSGPE
jgi:hypothetical protein